VSYILFLIIIRGILVLFIYITRLTSKEIYREVGQVKDLSAPWYSAVLIGVLITSIDKIFSTVNPCTL